MTKAQYTEEELIAIRVEKVYIRRKRVTVEHTIEATPRIIDAPAPPAPLTTPTTPALPASSLALPLPAFDFGVEDPPVNLFTLLKQAGDIPPVTALLGITTDRRPLLLPLGASGLGNVLISGQAGAGKATLLRTMLLSLALTNRPAQMQLALIDPMGQVLGALDTLPHRLAPLAVQPADVDNLLGWLVHEVHTRQRDHTRQTHIHAIVAVVNMPTAIARAVGSDARDALSYLAHHGDDVGVHLLCRESQPEQLPGALREAFSVQLVGRAADAEGKGKGDFLAVVKDSETTGFRAAACRPSEWIEAVAALCAGKTQSKLPASLLRSE